MVLLSKMTKRYLEDSKGSARSASRGGEAKSKRSSSPMKHLRRFMSLSEQSLGNRDRDSAEVANEIQQVITQLQ